MSYETDETSQSPLSALNAVQDTADVLRVAGDAGEMQESLDEAEDTSEELNNIKDIIEVVNANEAWSAPSLALLQNHLSSITRRLKIRDVNTGVSLEGVQDYRSVRVALEDVNRIIDAVDSSSAELQERSVAALADLINSLSGAIPRLKMRIDMVRRQSLDAAERSGGSVTFADPGILDRLKVDGTLPESLTGYIAEYCNYGERLLGRYATTAFNSAMRVDQFEAGLEEGSTQGYWDSLNRYVSQIQDPRKELTTSQMQSKLPGAVALFGDDVVVEDDEILVRSKMQRFVSAFKPTSLSAFSEQIHTSSDSTDGTAPALSVSDIKDITDYLTQLLEKVDVKSVSEACKAAWLDAGRAIRQVKQRLESSDESLLKSLGEHDKLLPAYLETIFALSAWPTLNYLTNLVLFGNALCDYSALSMSNVVTETAVDETPTTAEPVIEGSDTVVDVGSDNAEDGQADLEPDAKPTEPTEVPDTGETPDAPVDATGDGERAVVTEVGEQIADSGDAATGDDGDGEVAVDSETEFDVSGDTPADSDTVVDVAAEEPASEEAADAAAEVPADEEAGNEKPAEESEDESEDEEAS